MSERYVLHARLQECVLRANVSYKDFKALHHVAYTTFYNFIKNPETARDKTLMSIRLTCEFLDAAILGGYLPMPREQLKDRAQIVDQLYTQWWNNDKKLPPKIKRDEIELAN